jgi:hypothetical protein
VPTGIGTATCVIGSIVRPDREQGIGRFAVTRSVGTRREKRPALRAWLTFADRFDFVPFSRRGWMGSASGRRTRPVWLVDSRFAWVRITGTWASLAIIVMWLAVLFDAMFGQSGDASVSVPRLSEPQSGE